MQQLEKTETEVKIQTQAELAIKKAESLVIDNEDSLTLATDIIKYIKEKFKQAEAERKVIVDPFNKGVTAINSRFKTITEPLEKAERNLKTKMLTYQSELEKKRREEAEEKRKEVEQYGKDIAAQHKADGNEAGAAVLLNQLDKAMKIPVQIEKVRGGSTGATSTIKKTWTFKVVDIKALAQDRPELVEVISVEIRKLINAGARNIPGLEIYQEESLSIR